MRRGCMIVIMALAGCDSPDAPTPAITEVTQAVAKVAAVDADAYVVAVTDVANQHRLDDVLNPNPPKDFRWLMVKVLPPNAAKVRSGGFIADLSSNNAVTTFTQSYQDFCNPRVNDYSACWFIETLNSGAGGVSGQIHIRENDGVVTSAIEAEYKGLTTMYGLPATSYGHSTSSGFEAAVLGGGQ